MNVNVVCMYPKQYQYVWGLWPGMFVESITSFFGMKRDRLMAEVITFSLHLLTKINKCCIPSLFYLNLKKIILGEKM